MPRAPGSAGFNQRGELGPEDADPAGGPSSPENPMVEEAAQVRFHFLFFLFFFQEIFHRAS